MSITEKIALCREIIESITPGIKNAWGLTVRQRKACIQLARIYKVALEQSPHDHMVQELFEILKPRKIIIIEALCLDGNVTEEQQFDHALTQYYFKRA